MDHGTSWIFVDVNFSSWGCPGDMRPQNETHPIQNQTLESTMDCNLFFSLQQTKNIKNQTSSFINGGTRSNHDNMKNYIYIYIHKPTNGAYDMI